MTEANMPVNTQLNPLTREEFELPSGKTAIIREMTGREEDILSSEKLMRQGKATEMVLQNVIVSLDGQKPTDDDIQEMYSADREASLILMRKLSYGAIVESETTCDSCQKSFTVEVNLDELEFYPLPEDGRLDRQVRLSDGETIVTLRAMNGRDERRLFQTMQEGKDVMSAVLMVNVKEVSGLKSNQIRPWIQNLRVRDRNILRKAIESKRFGYKTDFRCNCPNCGAENQAVVTQLPGFFFPQELQE